MKSLFNELVLVALDNRKKLSRIPAEDEWQYLFEESVRQATCGVLLCGVEKLPKNQRPSSMVLYEWIGTVVQIESRNSLLNQRCIELQNLFAQGGFSTCILKGQGNALMYPEPLRRQSGDIDIWVNGKAKDILPFLATKCDMKAQVVGYHHTEFPLWNDVELEVHWRPSWKSSLVHDFRLQQWFRRKADKQFSNRDEKSGLYVPTWEFNVIFQLQHMYLHVLQEGLGLRHILDFYYLLISRKRDRVDLKGTLKWLDLLNFACAVMYVLKDYCGLKDEYLITPVDSKRGSHLLGEILQSGNFGHYDERNKILNQSNGISRKLAQLKSQTKFIWDYPIEVLCGPLRFGHILWRKLKLWRWE